MGKLSYLTDRLIIKQPRIRAFVTRLLFGDKDQTVNLFGDDLLINALRENGYLRAAGKAQTSSLFRDEVGVLISLSVLLRPGDTFVDVGANIGLYSCTMSRVNRLPGQAAVRFYAYEPHPDTFLRLKHNAEPCGVICRNFAVSDKEEELEFIDGAVSHVFTRIEEKSAYNINQRRFRVKTIPLEAEMIEGDSIVLKIDVEGQEAAVLKGARKWFEEQRVKAVYLDGFKNQTQIEDDLRAFGFDLLNGRSLRPFQRGDFSLLAINPKKMG